MVSRKMIWLQFVWNVGIWSSGFNILWSIIQEVRASLVYSQLKLFFRQALPKV
jgi:hypothetical protein